MELVELQIRNVYQTGTSFISARECEPTLVTFTSIDDVAKYVTTTLKGFYKERISTFSRWERLDKNNLNWYCCSESLSFDENLSTLKERFEIDKKDYWKCTGGGLPTYKIEVEKVGVNFKVTITTYVHIVISSDLFPWFTEEAMKEALINKITKINEG